MEIKVISRPASGGDPWAAANREFLSSRGMTMFNLIGSPGSGRTTLIEATVAALKDKAGIAAISCAPESSVDAQRLQRLGVPVAQVNTGAACRCEAELVNCALREIAPRGPELVFLENLGGLVCPALHDAGEDARVAVWSVTEGDDKAGKYPEAFRRARAVVISKERLLPCTNFRVEYARKSILQLNPKCQVFVLDSLTLENIDPWLEFVRPARRREQAKKMPPQKGSQRSRGDENNYGMLL